MKRVGRDISCCHFIRPYEDLRPNILAVAEAGPDVLLRRNTEIVAHYFAMFFYCIAQVCGHSSSVLV